MSKDGNRRPTQMLLLKQLLCSSPIKEGPNFDGSYIRVNCKSNFRVIVKALLLKTCSIFQHSVLLSLYFFATCVWIHLA
jgi:hypothetical protein